MQDDSHQAESVAPSGALAEERVLDITSDMLAPVEPREMRLDFERDISVFPRLTLVLLAAIVGVFVWEAGIGALYSSQSIIDAGAMYRPKILEGEIWRLGTAIFLHGGIEHLVGNAIMLYILGMACEHAIGWKQAAVLYFGAGLCGSILSMLMQTGPAVGASGAIFGLMGAIITFLYRYQRLFYLRDKRIGFVLLVWSAFQVGMGFLQPQIDNFAHIGGFLGGVMLVLFMKPRLGAEVTAGFDVIAR